MFLCYVKKNHQYIRSLSDIDKAVLKLRVATLGVYHVGRWVVSNQFMYEMSADWKEKLRLVRIALECEGMDSIHMEPIFLPNQVHLPCHNLEEYRLSALSEGGSEQHCTNDLKIYLKTCPFYETKENEVKRD